MGMTGKQLEFTQLLRPLPQGMTVCGSMLVTVGDRSAEDLVAEASTSGLGY